MKKALFLSILMHIAVMVMVIFNLPELLLPKKEIKALHVKIVSAKNVKKTKQKKLPKAVNTQQSSAPSQAKKKEKPKPKPKKKIEKKAPKIVNKAPSKKKVAVKKEQPKPKVEPKKEPPKKVNKETRPPKLDKTKDKKNIIKNKEAPKAEATPDDFLKALSFVEDLKAEQSAQFEGEDTEKTTLNIAEQAEIARIKKHIEKNWYKTPGTTGVQSAQIRIKVNRDGTLSSLDVINFEGSQSFIDSLKRAIRRSVPLPIPEEKYNVFKEIDLFWNG